MKVIRLPNPMMAPESLDLIGEQLADLNKRGISGAVVEAGCNNGLTSLFIASVITGTTRTLHCYDFFGPIPKSLAQLSNEDGESYVPLPQTHEFHMLFLTHPGVNMPIIHPGPFDMTMPKELPRQIAFALIDADYYASTRHALASILPRMAKGGLILIHDWEQVKWGPGVQKAVGEVWKGAVGFQRGLAVIAP